jgi:hypothetical protein
LYLRVAVGVIVGSYAADASSTRYVPIARLSSAYAKSRCRYTRDGHAAFGVTVDTPIVCSGAAIARLSTFQVLRLWINPLPQEYETSPTTVTDTGQKPIANPITSDAPATNNETCRSHDVRRILASFISQPGNRAHPKAQPHYVVV